MDWDLKREMEPKLMQLEEKTNKALVNIMKSRLEEESSSSSSGDSSSSDGDSSDSDNEEESEDES